MLRRRRGLPILLSVIWLEVARRLGASEAGITLWAVELTLLLPRHPVQARREHGELVVGLGDFVRWAAELTAYAEAVAPVDPVAAERAHRDARLARSRLN